MDTSFGNNGKLIVPNTTNVSTSNNDLAVWPSGEVLVTLNDNDLDEFRLLKFTSNGQLDTGFASAGAKTIPYLQGKSIGGIHATAISPTGQVLALFSSFNGNNDPSIREIHRMHPDGSMDQTFSSDGIYPLQGHNTWNDNMVYLNFHFDGSDKFTLAGTRSIQGVNYFMARQFLTELSVGRNDIISDHSDPLVYPNPVDANSTFNFELSEPGTVRLELLDMRGALVHNIPLPVSLLAAGEHSIQLNLPTSLAIGQYLLNLTTEQGAASVQVMVQ